MEIKYITDLLDNSEKYFPDKAGFKDKDGTFTFHEMKEAALAVSEAITAEHVFTNLPVAVLMDTGIKASAAILGILYSRNYYAFLDNEMPIERMRKITGVLKPRLIITDRKTADLVKELDSRTPVLLYEELMEKKGLSDPSLFKERRAGRFYKGHTEIAGTVPKGFRIPKASSALHASEEKACVVFTSGSTGIPKGVIQTHRSWLNVVLAYSETLGFESSDILGNQSPFYYGISSQNLINTLHVGGAICFIEKTLFSTPAALVEYLVENEITSTYWVANAYAMVARFDAWEGYEEKLKKYRRVVFAGEVMPTKYLNAWKKALPHIRYFQLYGSTEYVCSLHYEIGRELDDVERIPLGEPFPYVEVKLVKPDGTEAEPLEEGELRVSGPGLSAGYLNDEETTSAKYIEGYFHSGDIVKVNEFGELIFVNRNDFQIKHMGHRIELGEIEIAACSVDNIICGCVYDTEKQHIVLFYEGEVEEKQLKALLKEKLPSYMVPRKIIRLPKLPLNQNRKIDRNRLKTEFLK